MPLECCEVLALGRSLLDIAMFFGFMLFIIFLQIVVLGYGLYVGLILGRIYERKRMKKNKKEVKSKHASR